MKTKGFIVLTGASSGIGKSTAQLLSQEGYPLLLLARRKENMEQLQLANALVKSVDVLNIESFRIAIEEAKTYFQLPLEALINNAGVMLLGDVSQQSMEEWKAMINVNLIGVLHGTKLVLQEMVDQQWGTIINISSIAGRKTFPYHAVYCATKFAVHALTENIREEVANTGVRLVTIAPGVVETELLSHTSDTAIQKNYQSWKEKIQGGLAPETIASCILFALQQPPHVCIREIVVAPTRQEQ